MTIAFPLKHKVFVLTENHLKLMNRMWVGWNDDAYEGAPDVNLKRPYGNSDVVGDIAEIIDLEIPDSVRERMDEESDLFEDDAHYDWLETDEVREQCLKIHKETETAIQIVLSAQSFKTGYYVGDQYGNRWEWVSEEQYIINKLRGDYEYS